VGGLARAKAKSILGALARIRRSGAATPRLPAGDAASRGEGVPHLVPRGRREDGEHPAPFLLRDARLPVDTHVLRVTKRLGLVPATSSLAKAALSLEPHVGPGDHGPLHLNLIRLGRVVCRPRNPLCAGCPLLAVCPEGKRSTKGKGRIA